MAVTHDNQFSFRQSDHLSGVTVLNAVMCDFSYEKHAHEDIALGVTRAGRQDFICKGTRFKSLPGNILLFNPEDVHDGNPGNRSPLEYTMLYIRPDELAPLIHAAGMPESGSLRVEEPLFEDRVLRTHILTLSRLITGPGSSRLEQELHLYEIAKRLSRRLGRIEPGQRVSHKDALLLKVKEFIHGNLARDLSIDDLCSVANVSKFHFIRLFRSQFGITPHRYVLSCRVNRARTALEGGDAPSAVAQMCGFFDVSHLNRRFKQTYGLTPRQYQMQFSR